MAGWSNTRDIQGIINKLNQKGSSTGSVTAGGTSYDYDPIGDMGGYNSQYNPTPTVRSLTNGEYKNIVELQQAYDQQKKQQEWNDAANSQSGDSGSDASTSGYSNPYGYYSSAIGGFSSSSDPTEAQRKAAGNAKSIAYFNADNLKRQTRQMQANYDKADQQNRALADVENKQNSRKAASERFAANKKLQTALHGLLGAAGNALNGSANHELLNMIETRNDLDNNDAWSSLTQNRNTVENAYQEAVNQNVLSRNEAAINSEYAQRNLEAGLAADLNNINPELYEEPGEGGASVSAEGFSDRFGVPANLAKLSGYLMPDNAQEKALQEQPRNKLSGNDYYSRLINGYAQRKRG